MPINENFDLPIVGDSVRENCDGCHDVFHNHVFLPPKPAFTLQEDFYKTIEKVNSSIHKMLALGDNLEKKVDCMLSEVTSDNVEFKKLVTDTVNHFIGTAKNEINSFESMVSNAYEIFKTTMETEFADYVTAYGDFKKTTLNLINDFEESVNTQIQEINTYFKSNFGVTVRQELRNIKETGEMDELLKDGLLSDYALKNELNSYATKTELETEKSRINTIVSGTSSPDANAELIDIRVDEYGTTHATAGDAMRAHGTKAFSAQNANVYIGNNLGFTWRVLPTSDDAPDGGVAINFKRSIGFAIPNFGSSYSGNVAWDKITENIADLCTINGNECEIKLFGYRTSLCYVPATERFKIVPSGSVTKDDVVLISTGYQAISGGLLVHNEAYRLSDKVSKDFEKSNTAYNAKETTYFYPASGVPIVFTPKGVDGGLTIRFNSNLSIVNQGSGYSVNYNSCASHLIDRGNLVVDDNGATFTLKCYQCLVWRNASELNIVNREDVLSSDIILIANAWANPVAGSLLNNYSFVKVDALERSINAINSETTYALVNDEKIEEYTSLVSNNNDVHNFMYFTDPHLGDHWNSKWEDNLKNNIAHLGNCFNRLNLDFCLCNGDWLIQNDSKAEATHKLHTIAGVMNKTFGHFYTSVGNHDYNYQYYVDGSNGLNEDILTPTEIRNCWFRDHEKTYYTFSVRNTLYVVFDTGIDWNWYEDLNSYRDGQFEWFANILKDNKYDHVVMVMHIVYNDATHNGVAATAQTLHNIARSFNERSGVEFNGNVYNFADGVGKVEFTLTGHTHADNISSINNIPVICTANSTLDGVPTYDLVQVDFDARKIDLIRVGSGSNRSVSI